jgi:hypothetical protein
MMIVRKLNKKTGKTIAEELKQLTSTIHDTQAQLTKTLLLSCDGDTCGAKGTSLVQDVFSVMYTVSYPAYSLFPRDCFNFLWYSRGARFLKPPCVCCFFLIRLGPFITTNANKTYHVRKSTASKRTPHASHSNHPECPFNNQMLRYTKFPKGSKKTITLKTCGW